jgi:hypothetical protein
MKDSLAFVCLVTLLSFLNASKRDALYICDAKKIDSYDLLIGDWDTSIRLLTTSSWKKGKQRTQVHANLFEAFAVSVPANTTQLNQIESNYNEGQVGPHIGLLQHFTRRRNNNLKRRQQHSYSYPCRLSLYPNGTFGIVSHNLNPTNHQRVSLDRHLGTTLQEQEQLLIRGKWTLQKNPYCVTDRFYDTIVLESYPRVKKELQQITIVPIKYSSQNNATTTGEAETITTTTSTLSYPDHINQQNGRATKNNMITTAIPIRKMQLKLQCRLSGHFTGGGRRYDSSKYYARGKLTHGTMVLSETVMNPSSIDKTLIHSAPSKLAKAHTPSFGNVSSWFHRLHDFTKKRPRIIASFSAQRFIPSITDLNSQSNDDLEEYDY